MLYLLHIHMGGRRVTVYKNEYNLNIFDNLTYIPILIKNNNIFSQFNFILIFKVIIAILNNFFFC